MSNCKSTLDSVDEPCLAVRQNANFFLGSSVKIDNLLSSDRERSLGTFCFDAQALFAISLLDRN